MCHPTVCVIFLRISANDLDESMNWPELTLLTLESVLCSEYCSGWEEGAPAEYTYRPVQEVQLRRVP
jgi:hypothetical protein